MSTSDTSGHQQPSGSGQPQHSSRVEYRNTGEDTDLDESDNNLLDNTTFDQFARDASENDSLTSGPRLVPNRTNLLRPSVLNMNHNADADIQVVVNQGAQGNPGIALQPMGAGLPRPFNHGPPPDDAYEDDLNDVIDRLRFLNTGTTTPTTTPLPPIPQIKSLEPVYLTPHEQFLKLNNDELKKSKQNVDMLTSVSELVIKQAQLIPNRDSLTLANNLLKQSLQYRDESIQLERGIQKAQTVVNHYKQSIPTPRVFANDGTNINIRDIISLTGYFDPEKNGAEFRHIWMKLYDFGLSQQFSEQQYIQALSAILKNEAYDAFCDLRERKASLDEILEYFITIYGNRRSIVSDKSALDNFTRKKLEPIRNCIEKCKMVVDRLRHTYPETSWPEMRIFLLKQTILQLILPETKTYITSKENHILETTGFHFPIDQFIITIDEYETLHNKIPKFDMQSGKAAAATKLQDDNLLSQVSHLKQEQKKAQSLEKENEFLKEFLSTNYTRNFKNSDRPDRSRERRKEEIDQRRQSSRSSSIDRARQISTAEPPKTNTPVSVAFQDQQSAYKRPESPSPFTRRPRSDTPEKTGYNFRTDQLNKPSSFDFRTDRNDRTDRDNNPSQIRVLNSDYQQRERGRTPYRDNGSYNRPSTPYYDRYASRERDSSGSRYQNRPPYDSRRNDYQPRSYSNNGYRPYNRENSYSRPSYNRDTAYNRRDSRNNSSNRNPYNRENSYTRNRDSQNRSNSRDGYNKRSTSYDKAHYNLKERSNPDPKTEKLTFANDDKMVYLTIVEKPNLN